jgi:hypothetical protein
VQCDLRSGSCGQCIRAHVSCTGYRDTQQLRVRDESRAVRIKALSKYAPHLEPCSPPLSLDVQARDAFFAYYVTGTSKTWDFLKPFFDLTQSPEHLRLSIDAASLAYLSHQVYSDAAITTAREKYVSALRMTNKALESPEVAARDTTLLTSLLLDLFEKITNSESRHSKSWTGHAAGALALVKLRGLDQFQDPAALRVLVRLSTNFLIGCVASDTPVPDELVALRAHAGKQLDVRDPKWRLTDLMVDFANLRSDIRRNHLSIEQYMSFSLDLDAKLQTLALDMPPSWQYKTTLLDRESERTYNNRFDSYADRHATQTWNVLRLVRILLNESILEYCLVSAGSLQVDEDLVGMAKDNIKTLACEICFSASQYVGCLGAARGMLSSQDSSTGPGVSDSAFDGAQHLHSPSQNLDCYTLIFPLYVAGRSRSSPNGLRSWVIEQLHYMGSHFGIRNAGLVRQILEQGTDVNPWTVYAMLGSYAFAA